MCNDDLYSLLHAYHGTETLAGFIHVPFLPSQSKEGVPSLTLEQITQALEIAVSVLP